MARRGGARCAASRPAAIGPGAVLRDHDPAVRREAERGDRRRRGPLAGRDPRRRSRPARSAPASARLLQAPDSVRGGAKQALVAIADCRLGAPEGKAEQPNGDGAVAFVLGSENVIAEIEATASVTREFLDTWRAPGERFAHTWEERFALTQAYGPLAREGGASGPREGQGRARKTSPRSCSTRRTRAPSTRSRAA